MLTYISTLDELEVEAQTIDEFLQTPCSDDAGEAVQRGNDLVVYLARSGKMLADAKYHKDQALATSIIRALGEQAGAPASILNKLVCRPGNR